jgi:hypothetical protein
MLARLLERVIACEQLYLVVDGPSAIQTRQVLTTLIEELSNLGDDDELDDEDADALDGDEDADGEDDLDEDADADDEDEDADDEDDGDLDGDEGEPDREEKA